MVGIRFSADAVAAQSVELDPSQRAVLDLPAATTAAIIGAPGTGKTTVLLELLADRVQRLGWSPDSVLVLAPSRVSATRLRDAAALRLGVATDGPRVRTVPSLAFEIVTSAARRVGAPVPRLITGGEQDADFAALIDGHIEEMSVEGRGGPSWPEHLGPHVRRLRAFRTELRELLARSTEHGITPQRLSELGHETDRPEWVAAGRFLEEYLDVVSSARPAQYDSAELAEFAVRAILDATAGDRIEGLRLVVVDDLQEAPESTLRVLRALATRGIPILAFGDPDVAANAFRGGEPDALGRLSAVLGVDTQQLVLSTVHRHPADIRALVSTITARIGAAHAGTQRAALAVGPVDAGAEEGRDDAAPDTHSVAHSVTRIESLSPAREAAAIARILREEHLFGGVPWSRMAVVVRSGMRVPALARSLQLSDVPTRSGSGGIALRDESAARALLMLVDVGSGRSELTPPAAEDLLLGPYGGLDALQLRRLRRALRAEELAGGGARSGGELIADALGHPSRLATIDSKAGRAAARLAATLAALHESDGSIEDLLWLAWERSGTADSWKKSALSAGLGSAEANRNLDGVVALFTSAKRFSERRPDAPAAEFLAEVLDAEVPEDILVPRSVDDAVLVTTPSGTVGLEVDVVVVAALQQGSWPNLRPRGSLLSPQRLAGAALAQAGDTAIDERRIVLDDELRMFALAVSRATRRVVLSAVANDDEASSVLLRIGAPSGDAGVDSDAHPDRLPLSLRATVGRLRRIAASRSASPVQRAQAASTLRALADEHIPGADPGEWHGLGEISTIRPLFDGEKIPVSPSAVDKLIESPLDWFLDRIAGGDPGLPANVGTIVHWAMETAEDPSIDAVWAAIDARWNELAFESPWLGERQRRLVRVLAGGVSEYLTDFGASGKKLIGAEKRFQLELGEAIVSGSIDRVERAADGSVVIVDLKTGTPVTNAQAIAEHPQLGAYQLAYSHGVLDEALAEHGEHRAGGAKLVFVKSGIKGKSFREATQVAFDAEQLDGVRERIMTAARLIAAAEFDGLVDVEDRGPYDKSHLRINRVKAVSSD